MVLPKLESLGGILAVAVLGPTFGGLACAAETPRRAADPAPASPPSSDPSPVAIDPTPAATTPISTSGETSPAAAHVFPPPDFTPPHERSARPGDGQWARLGDASKRELAAEGEPAMVMTVVRPHPISPLATIHVVAIDLGRAALHLVPGTEEPASETVPASERWGLVPAQHQERLLAVFNGGYLARHGRWGMMVDGTAYLPPRDEGCTVAIHRDGRASIRMWSALSASADELVSYRQTPPCLLEEGEVSPKLVAGDDKAFGGHDPAGKTRRRSAVGVDATGRVLFYALGFEPSPRELAEGLRAAGAVHAAQLDINWSWTRFLIFGRPTPDAELQVTSTLVPKMTHRARGYVHHPHPRDFFYVRLR